MHRVSITPNLLRGFFILIFLLGASTSQASTVDEDPTTWPREKLKQEIKITKENIKLGLLAQNIQIAHANIKADANCSKALRLAEKYKKEMLALNQQYAGRANNEYQRRFTTAKKNNNEQLTKYRQCVSRVLFNSGKSKVIGVSTYDGLQNLTAEIENQLDAKSVDDIGMYLVKIEDYLKELEAALKAIDTSIKVIGTLEGVYKGVKVKSPGSRWLDGRKGYVFRINDELKTGELGRARIVFNDRDRHSGPTVLNVGSSAHIRIKSLAISKSSEHLSTGVLDIFRGVVRAFTKSWASGSSFSIPGGTTLAGRGSSGGAFNIRTGTSLVGIRGTEVTLDYNPDSDTLAAHVDHGTVDIYSKSGTHTLTNREKITVKNGIAGSKTSFNQSEWTAVLQRTPDIGKVSLSDIANQISSRQLMGIQPQALRPSSTTPFSPDEAICVARKVCKPNQEECRIFIMGCGDNLVRLSAKERDRCMRQRNGIIKHKIPALQCLDLNRQASDRQVSDQQVFDPPPAPPIYSSPGTPPPFTPDRARCIAKDFCKPMPSGKICWDHILECSVDQSRLSENAIDRCRAMRKNMDDIQLCVNLK